MPVVFDDDTNSGNPKTKQRRRGRVVFDSGGGAVGEFDFFDTAKDIYGALDKSAKSILFAPNKALGQVQDIADEKGTQLAERLATMRGMTPEAAATAGLILSMAPDIAMEAVQPGGGLVGAAGRQSKKLPGAASKLLSGVFGTPEAALQRRFMRPGQVKAAMSKGSEAIANRVAKEVSKLKGRIQQGVKNFPTMNDIGQSLAQRMNKMEETIGEMTTNAYKLLGDGQTISRNEMADILRDVQKGIRGSLGEGIGAQDKRALSAMQDIINSLESMGNKTKLVMPGGSERLADKMLSEGQIRELVLKLRKNIDWEKAVNTETNLALKNAQHAIDNILAERNPAFKAELVPLKRMIDISDDAAQKFSLAKDQGAFIPGDTTANKLKNLLSETRTVTGKTAAEVESATGIPLKKMVRQSAFKESIEAGKVPARNLRDVAPKMYRQARVENLARKQFALPDDELVTAGDTAAGRILRAPYGEKFGSKTVLNALGKESRPGLVDDVEDAAAAREILMNRTQGSRRTGIGFASGLALDGLLNLVGIRSPFMSTAIGTTVGGLADVYGGRAAGALTDLIRAGQGMSGRLTSSPLLDPRIISAIAAAEERQR